MLKLFQIDNDDATSLVEQDELKSSPEEDALLRAMIAKSSRLSDMPNVLIVLEYDDSDKLVAIPCALVRIGTFSAIGCKMRNGEARLDFLSSAHERPIFVDLIQEVSLSAVAERLIRLSGSYASATSQKLAELLAPVLEG